MNTTVETPKTMHEFYPVGSILKGSWGYDQTNIDFYEVIKQTPKGIKLQQVGKTQVESEEDGFTGKVVPDKTVKIGNAFNKRPYTYMEGWSILHEHAILRPWSGDPVAETYYA